MNGFQELKGFLETLDHKYVTKLFKQYAIESRNTFHKSVEQLI